MLSSVPRINQARLGEYNLRLETDRNLMITTTESVAVLEAPFTLAFDVAHATDEMMYSRTVALTRDEGIRGAPSQWFLGWYGR
jgi:hypothetical protein